MLQFICAASLAAWHPIVMQVDRIERLEMPAAFAAEIDRLSWAISESDDPEEISRIEARLAKVVEQADRATPRIVYGLARKHGTGPAEVIGLRVSTQWWRISAELDVGDYISAERDDVSLGSRQRTPIYAALAARAALRPVEWKDNHSMPRPFEEVDRDLTDAVRLWTPMPEFGGLRMRADLSIDIEVENVSDRHIEMARILIEFIDGAGNVAATGRGGFIDQLGPGASQTIRVWLDDETMKSIASLRPGITWAVVTPPIEPPADEVDGGQESDQTGDVDRDRVDDSRTGAQPAGR